MLFSADEFVWTSLLTATLTSSTVDNSGFYDDDEGGYFDAFVWQELHWQIAYHENREPGFT